MQSIDISPLEHGLKQCFADKNNQIKKDIAVEFEIFAVPSIMIFHQMIKKISINFLDRLQTHLLRT